MVDPTQNCIDDHLFSKSILLSVVQKLTELLNDAFDLPFLFIVAGQIKVEGIADCG